MLPTGPDFVAMALQIGEFFRSIGPFILFGAAVAAAQVTLFRRPTGPWRGHRIIAPIAAIPLGIPHVIAGAFRSWLLHQTTLEEDDSGQKQKSGVLNRVLSYLDGLIFPFLLSSALGAALIVLTPTDPLWTLLSPPEPWRLLIAPLAAGALKPRGGTELPLIMAMVAKGLDPAGAVAGIAGAGYRHARSWPLAGLHILAGSAVGILVWQIPVF